MCRAAAGISDAGSDVKTASNKRDQGSQPQRCDFIVDPLAALDLGPLRAVLELRAIVLHGADYDLRMLRRGLGFTAHKIFDTLIAARLLGIREFGLAALLKLYFGLNFRKDRRRRIGQNDRCPLEWRMHNQRRALSTTAF